MAKQTFIVNGHDYAKYISELKPSRNDLDADGSGRNLLDGLMYRRRVATKLKYAVTFIRLNESQMMQLLNDMSGEYLEITTLDAKTNRPVKRTYYCSTINEGVPRTMNDSTYYDGITFDVIER